MSLLKGICEAKAISSNQVTMGKSTYFLFEMEFYSTNIYISAAGLLLVCTRKNFKYFRQKIRNFISFNFYICSFIYRIKFVRFV